MTTSPAVAALCADAGRPDATELSRVLAVRLLRRAGEDIPDRDEFAPHGSVTRTPTTWQEIAPGDTDALEYAATGWLAFAERHDEEPAELAREVRDAHARLGVRLSGLHDRARAIAAAAEAVGIPMAVLGDARRASEFIGSRPLRAETARELVEQLIAVRLDWLDATQDFVDDLGGVRGALGIADW